MRKVYSKKNIGDVKNVIIDVQERVLQTQGVRKGVDKRAYERVGAGKCCASRNCLQFGYITDTNEKKYQVLITLRIDISFLRKICNIINFQV